MEMEVFFLIKCYACDVMFIIIKNKYLKIIKINFMCNHKAMSIQGLCAVHILMCNSNRSLVFQHHPSWKTEEGLASTSK